MGREQIEVHHDTAQVFVHFVFGWLCFFYVIRLEYTQKMIKTTSDAFHWNTKKEQQQENEQTE